MKTTLKKLSLALAILSITSFAAATERALVIGIGHYEQPGIDLPGIDLDVDMAKKMLKLQGFQDSEIKILTNDQATAAKVKGAIHDWLGEAKQGERAVLYFSGHGTRIPEPKSTDGVESALVTFDTRPAFIDGHPSLANVIRSSEFIGELRALPSKTVYAYVDACHSGGMAADKSLKIGSRNIAGIESGTAKFFSYPGMPAMPNQASKGFRSISAIPESDAEQSNKLNFVAMLAAEKDEYAMATSKGSAFTLGISNELDKAIQESKPVTPMELTSSVATFIKDNIAESHLHHPVLRGNAKLKATPLSFSAPAADGQTWQSMAGLAGKLQPLALTANKEIYAVGEKVNYELTVPREGYLNIVTIDANDQATLLFPNPHFNGSNYVKAGKLSIPADLGGFEFEASAPHGKTLTVAILTDKKLNLLDESIGTRDPEGKWISSQFGSLSASGTSRAVIVTKAEASALAGMVIFDVK